MKKGLILLMALLMLLSSSALAEVRIDSVTELDRMIFLSTATNCYYKSEIGYSQVYNADGEPISDRYQSMNARKYGLYYEFYGSGLNQIGLLDRNGQVIAEPSYGKVVFYDDAWALAYVLEPTDNQVGDFKDTNNNQYMVARTDVLYEGRIIGSLSREEFNPGLSYGTAGKYLYVKTTSEAGYYIDRHFNIIRVDKGISSSEFTGTYGKGMFHNPTQQWAFCETCTLTEEDVTYAIWYNDQTGCLLDLQGHVIKSGVVSDRVRNVGDYLSFRMSGKYGVMDKQGNIIIQPMYKEIMSDPFIGEYQTALTDEGHLHFIDRQGNVTAKAEYSLSSSDYKGAGRGSSFVLVSNMGKYMVFTATKGQLPTMYEDARTPKTNHQILIVKQDGLWGAIDVDGNTVLPFVHRNAMEITDDGTLVYGTSQDGTKYLYRLSYDDAAPATATELPREAMQSGETMTDAPALAPGAWECPCGTINTGKFCAECGSAKPTPTPEPTAAPTPANDGSWVCTCGSQNSGKFCPECGAARPAAEPQCASCGYKPEGDAPKFCPECGTKFGAQ